MKPSFLAQGQNPCAILFFKTPWQLIRHDTDDGRGEIFLHRGRTAAIHEAVWSYCCEGACGKSAAGKGAGKAREVEERKDTLSPGKIPGLQGGYPPIRNRLACSLYQQRGGTGNPVCQGQGEGIRMLQNRERCRTVCTCAELHLNSGASWHLFFWCLSFPAKWHCSCAGWRMWRLNRYPVFI